MATKKPTLTGGEGPTGFSTMTAVELGVVKAYPTDSGRGILRISPETLISLEVGVDDVDEIEGGDRTMAEVWGFDR